MPRNKERRGISTRHAQEIRTGILIGKQAIMYARVGELKKANDLLRQASKLSKHTFNAALREMGNNLTCIASKSVVR